MLLPQVVPLPAEKDSGGVSRTPLIVLGVVTTSVAFVVAGFFAVRSTTRPSADVPQTPAIIITTTAVPSGDAFADVTPPAKAEPVVTTKTITENSPVAFATRTVRDRTQPKGTRTVRKQGVPDLRRATFEITYHDEVTVNRRLVRSVVATQPVTEVIAIGTGKSKTRR